MHSMSLTILDTTWTLFLSLLSSLSLSLWPHRSPILNLVPLSVHISRLSCRHTCSPRQFRFQFRMLSMRWRATTPLLNPRPRFTKEKQANLFAKFKQHFVVFFLPFFGFAWTHCTCPVIVFSPLPLLLTRKLRFAFFIFLFFLLMRRMCLKINKYKYRDGLCRACVVWHLDGQCVCVCVCVQSKMGFR